MSTSITLSLTSPRAKYSCVTSDYVLNIERSTNIEHVHHYKFLLDSTDYSEKYFMSQKEYMENLMRQKQQ